MRREILDDGDAVAARAEALVNDRLAAALRDRRRGDLVLAGGSTPKRLYERLGQSRDTLDWPRIHLWFGDERTVAPDHADSNFGMVQRALLTALQAAPPVVHRIDGESSPADAALVYEQELATHARPEAPRFDVVLLGMGADGHTASLFPGSSLVDETERLVAAGWIDRLATSRISLTLPALRDAGLVLFLVVGADKADRVAQILDDGVDFPAGRVGAAPGAPDTLWLLDRAAASKLR